MQRSVTDVYSQHPTSEDRPDNAYRRIGEIDIIRAAAIVLVVLLHSSSPVMYQIGTTPLTVWAVHNFIDSAARICVPLFFMVSGYLLLSPSSGGPSSTADVLRRLAKILVPLLVWSIFYRVQVIFVNGGWPHPSDVLSAIADVFQGAVVYHLWFLYELTALYLLLPLLRRLFQPNHSAANYFILLWFTILSAHLVSGLTGWRFPIGNYVNLGNSGYLVLGHIIRRVCGTPSGRTAGVAAVVYFTTAIFTTYLTEVYSLSSKTYVEVFHVYATPNVVLMSASAFIALLYAGARIRDRLTLSKAISLVGSHSFGIYLVHVMVLERIGYNIFGTPAATISGAAMRIVATASFVLVCSFFIAWCLRRSPLTRWIAP